MNLASLPVNEDKKSVILNSLVDQAFTLAEEHINLIVYSIKTEIKNKNADELISIYSDYLVAKIFENFDKDQIISYISSGFLNEIRSLVVEKLYNHEVIREVIEYKEAVPV